MCFKKAKARAKSVFSKENKGEKRSLCSPPSIIFNCILLSRVNKLASEPLTAKHNQNEEKNLLSGSEHLTCSRLSLEALRRVFQMRLRCICRLCIHKPFECKGAIHEGFRLCNRQALTGLRENLQTVK